MNREAATACTTLQVQQHTKRSVSPATAAGHWSFPVEQHQGDVFCEDKDSTAPMADIRAPVTLAVSGYLTFDRVRSLPGSLLVVVIIL